MQYQRNLAVNETEVDGEYFLVEPDSGEIYYLDVLSSAFWRLIEEPRDEGEILRTLIEAFPDAKADAIENDLRTLLADLLAKKLIQATSLS